MIYRNIKLSLVQFNDWVDQEFESARIIFHQCLCFNYEDIPTYRSADLQDNWDASEPGDWFMDNTQNRNLLELETHWLWDRIMTDIKLKEKFFERDETSDQWIINPIACSEYEKDVQKFLERMLVLIHIGSGQPSRKPEFLGKCELIASCNSAY
jgi:hypothetical protein